MIRLAGDALCEYPLSLRNVEDLVSKRGIDISYETVRQWRWHLDEMCVKINGETLESFVTKNRDSAAAMAFMKKVLEPPLGCPG